MKTAVIDSMVNLLQSPRVSERIGDHVSEISKWQKFVLFTCNKYVASFKCEKNLLKIKRATFLQRGKRKRCHQQCLENNMSASTRTRP